MTLSHESIITSTTVEQHCAILANAMRASLHQISGDDPDRRMMTLAAFLFHLCQVEPERTEKMRGILNALRDAVAPEAT